jgi:hypothetical protein
MTAVHGTDLELRRALAKLEEQLSTEKERVRLACASERGAVKAMRDASLHAQSAERDAERCRDLWEYDRARWERDHVRLRTAAIALHAIASMRPDLAEYVDGWREQIWGIAC